MIRNDTKMTQTMKTDQKLFAPAHNNPQVHLSGKKIKINPSRCVYPHALIILINTDTYEF